MHHTLAGTHASHPRRHDWTLDRCGTQVQRGMRTRARSHGIMCLRVLVQVKYIIDFYEGRAPPSMPGGQPIALPTVYLDVRPAPSLGGWIDIVRLKASQFFTVG